MGRRSAPLAVLAALALVAGAGLVASAGAQVPPVPPLPPPLPLTTTTSTATTSTTAPAPPTTGSPGGPAPGPGEAPPDEPGVDVAPPPPAPDVQPPLPDQPPPPDDASAPPPDARPPPGGGGPGRPSAGGGSGGQYGGMSPAAVAGSYRMGAGGSLLATLLLVALVSLSRTGGNAMSEHRRTRLALGVVCIALAAGVGLVGYLKLSLEPEVNRQIPYLASAGMALVLLAVTGGSLVVAEQLRADDRRIEDLEAAVRALAGALAPTVEAPARRGDPPALAAPLGPAPHPPDPGPDTRPG